MLVFTYHSISNGPAPLCIPVERFAQQLDFLQDAGWKPAPLRELVRSLDRPQEDRKRFALTFDDGYRDFAEAAWPLLRERDLPATLFTVASGDRENLAGGIGAPLVPLSELRSLADEGVEIAAHGIEHTDLRGLDDSQLASELKGGRATLENASGRSIENFAYPFGSYDDRVRAAAARCFRCAFTTQLAALHCESDPHALPRVDAFYLDDPRLRLALQRGNPDSWLRTRRWLRRARGSEPRRAIPRRPRASAQHSHHAPQRRLSQCP